MSTNSAREFLPTIIDSRPLLPRLASELIALEQECKRAWPAFKTHPVNTSARVMSATIRRSRQVLLAPNVLAALLTISNVVVVVVLTERRLGGTFAAPDPENATSQEVNLIELNQPDNSKNDGSIGRNGSARVGYRHSRGEGSGEVRMTWS